MLMKQYKCYIVCLKLKAKSIKLYVKNGAKATDSKEKTYNPTESEALAPKEKKLISLAYWA